MALKNQGVEHEVVAISEVDEYALLSYHAIHTSHIKVEEASEEEMQKYMEEKNIPLDTKGKRKILKNKKLRDLYEASMASNNLGDICKITDDKIPKVDLFTYSFPCQDISQAGKKKGLEKNSGTRSSLLWECEKIIEAVKPKYLLMENVKPLVNKKNKPHFDMWLEYLEELGYKNFWQVLNARDYGIPQNRERVFVVSALDEDVDYKFSAKKPLTLKLKDILEDNVDDSYYLSEAQVEKIQSSNYELTKARIQEKDYSSPLLASDAYQTKCVNIRVDENAMNFKTRCLTPLEYWRLMGITDEDFEKANKAVSNSQLYKQAGNSIVVDVLEGIFKQLFTPDEND